MVQIYFSSFKSKIPEEKFNALLQLLPVQEQKKINQYLRWEDAHLGLLGKLLLIRGLKHYGLNKEALLSLKFTEYSRPYLEGNIDFNISHSGNFVACAISDQCKLGLDIEQIKSIELNHFESNWNAGEWKKICNADPVYPSFFDAWTQKEAIIKADGHGLSIPLKEIIISSGQSTIFEKTWYLHKVTVHPQYAAHLATDTESPNIQSTYIEF